MWRYYDWIARLFRRDGLDPIDWLFATVTVLIVLFWFMLASA